MPLLHGLARSLRKNRRPAEHLYFLNAAGFAYQSLQNNRALHFHLLREQRIAGVYARNYLRTSGRKLDLRRGGRRPRSAAALTLGRLLYGSRGTGLHVEFDGTVRGADSSVLIAGHYLNLKRR